MLKAILFDLDHTLIDWDSVEPWEQYQARRMSTVFDYVHREVHPLPGVEPQEFFAAFASGMHQAWESGVKTLQPPSVIGILTEMLHAYGVPDDQLDIDALMAIYDWQPPVGLQAFPDVPDVLPELESYGVELGIITNASLPMRFRDRELKAAGILDWFPTCRLAAVDVGVLKPHRDIFDSALDMLEVEPEEAVFVGDNLEADIRGAQSVGMYAVWRPRPGDTIPDDMDVQPDGTITTLHDLLPLLDEWYPGWRHNGHAR